MTLPYPIVAAQTDARSPVDDHLMDSIRQDLDYIDTNLSAQQTYDYQWKLNGALSALPINRYKRLDLPWISKDQTFSTCKLFLSDAGNGGTIEIDLRRYTKPDVKIAAITRKFSSSINSIARVGTAMNTQSVTRSTAQINTQSITLFKTAINVSSIVPLGSNLMRYNLASAPDSAWVVGDSVTFASCTSGANNGTFVIVKVNDDNGANVVITNNSGVAQSGAVGNATLLAFSYNYTGAVDTNAFKASYLFKATSHTTGGNNGDLIIYAVNSGGNNIIVKNPSGTTQGGIAGTADTYFWIFAFSSLVSTTDYAIGEQALGASHSSSENDGNKEIIAVNQGGNNLILYVHPGAVQGGAAGNVSTNRWTIFFSVDPSANFSVGETAIISSATTSANNGSRTVKQVNRTTSDNVVLYDLGMVAQPGAAGTLINSKVLVKFGSDQSATITTDSRIQIFGSAQLATDGDYSVSEVNRGGGANYNAVIDASAAVEEVGAAGRVVSESKSLFDTRPSVVIPASTNGFYGNIDQVSTNAVFNATKKIVTAGTLIMMDVISIPSGTPRNLMVQLL